MADYIANFQSKVIDFTPTLDTTASTAGDVIADFEKITFSQVSSAITRGTINGVTVIDKDDEGAEIDIIISDKDDTTPPVLGTEGSAVSISDADAATIIGTRNIPSGNYVDLIGNQVAKPDVHAPIPFDLNKNYLYIGLVTRGTPQYGTASDLVLRFHVTIES